MSQWKVIGMAASVLALAGCGGGRPAAPVAPAASPQPADAAGGAEVAAERAKLAPDDRAAVEAQEWCAVSTSQRLGDMGPPVRLEIKDQVVFLCCKSCRRKAEADPDKTLAAVAELKAKKLAGAAR